MRDAHDRYFRLANIVFLERIQARSLNTQVYRRLKAALITGQFAPGQVLLIRDLAEQVGTSPMPIRQALSRLVSENALVEDNKVRSSVRVPELSASVFQELRAVRQLVEAEAAALAAEKARPVDIKRLRTLNAAVKQAVGDEDATKAIQANFDFHFEIYDIADCTILRRTIESLWLQSGPYFRMLIESSFSSLHDAKTEESARAGLDKALARNDRIIETLAKNDVEAARNAMRDDINRTAEFFLAIRSDQVQAQPATGRRGPKARKVASASATADAS